MEKKNSRVARQGSKAKTPVERLLRFLSTDEEDAYSISDEEVDEEIERDGIDRQKLAENIKNAILEAFDKAQGEVDESGSCSPDESAFDDPPPLKQTEYVATDRSGELEEYPVNDEELIDTSLLSERFLFESSTRSEDFISADDASPEVFLSLPVFIRTSPIMVSPFSICARSALQGVVSIPPLGEEKPHGELQKLTKADRLGLADTIINMTGEQESIIVRPVTAMRNYLSPRRNPITIGRNEKADFVLDARGGQADERLIVSVQLLDMRSGERLGEQMTYNESITDVYKVGSLIYRQIAHELGLSLPGDVMGRRRKRYTEYPEALRNYNLGRFHWNRLTEPELIKAIGKFRQAIKIDSEYAEAYAGMADCYIWMGILNMRSPQETFIEAREKALAALARDDTIAEAYTSLAFTEMYLDWNWKGAEEHFQCAIKFNPNYQTAYQGYAQLLTALKRFEEAIATIDKALEIDPKSFIVNVVKGIILYTAERYDESIEQFNATVHLNPKFDASYYGLALALEQKGRLKEAEKESRRAIVRSKRNPIKLTARAHIHGILKETEQAQRVLSELNELRRTHHYVSPFHMALIYAALGEKDRAFDFLEEAYNDRDQWLTLVCVEPRLSELRKDPRFDELVLKLNFPFGARRKS